MFIVAQRFGMVLVAATHKLLAEQVKRRPEAVLMKM